MVVLSRFKPGDILKQEYNNNGFLIVEVISLKRGSNGTLLLRTKVFIDGSKGQYWGKGSRHNIWSISPTKVTKIKENALLAYNL